MYITCCVKYKCRMSLFPFISSSGRLTLLKETARFQELRTSNDVPMAALCTKSWVVPNKSALVPAVFNYRSIEICMGKIKNTSNFRINEIRNDQR